MAVSANTLFHFTDEKLKLMGILKNSFYPNYSLEDISNATPEKSIYQAAYIPMVCFCDLLFSQIKTHIDFYGDYGIGLRKNGWGIEKGISPIFYFPEESISANLIQSVATEITAKLKVKSERVAVRKQLQNFYKCVKPFDGKAFNRKEKKLEDRIFYDEREWRFVPKNFPVVAEKRATKILLQRANEKMMLDEKLTFGAKDVKYIILKKENEIPDFVNYIERELKSVFGKDDRKLLVSKLISVEQVREDM